jgi:hypothetical protein
MAKRKDVIAMKLFAEIMKQGENPPLHPGEVEIAVFNAFDEWREYLVQELTNMLKTWEVEVPNDDSLYTLGLRRAVDVINGDDPIIPPPIEAV